VETLVILFDAAVVCYALGALYVWGMHVPASTAPRTERWLMFVTAPLWLLGVATLFLIGAVLRVIHGTVLRGQANQQDDGHGREDRDSGGSGFGNDAA